MTTWTDANVDNDDYIDGDPFSLWDAHDWDEFTWDGTGTLPTWTDVSGTGTTWS